MVMGCDGDGLGCCGESDRGMNLKEGGIARDPYEGEKLGRGVARRDTLMGMDLNAEYWFGQ